MSRELVPDVLWETVKPLLPVHEPSPKGGRPRADDRECFIGIVFVLRSGLPWNDIPAELCKASPATCWRRFDEWSKAGIWEEVWQLCLAVLNATGKLNLKRAIVDSASMRALKGGLIPAPTRPTAASQAASVI